MTESPPTPSGTDGSTAARVRVRVNGVDHEWDVDATSTLVDLLRNRLSLTGCREACGIGVCGSCAVLLDGRAVSACLTLGFTLDGATVVTAEGLDGAGWRRVQEAFISEQAFQCSFCTPGFAVSVAAMLQDPEPEPEPQPEGQIERALAGHLCRCGSYQEVSAAARRLLREADVSDHGPRAVGEGREHGH